jgi:SAM-dependent methyltransferase
MAERSFKDIERAGWNERANVYEDTTALTTIQSIPALLAAVKLRPRTDLLDICSGPGYAAGAALALGANPTGIDFAAEMVTVAARRFPGCRFEIGDAENLKFADETFDAAVCNFGGFHFAHAERAFGEAYRVLKPSGRYAFSQWMGLGECDFFDTIFAILNETVNMDVGLPEAPLPFRFSDRDTCRDCLEAAGFQDIEITDVANRLHVSASENFADMFRKFSVRITMILDLQTTETRQRFEESLNAAMKRFVQGDDYVIPMPSIVVSGQKN